MSTSYYFAGRFLPGRSSLFVKSISNAAMRRFLVASGSIISSTYPLLAALIALISVGAKNKEAAVGDPTVGDITYGDALSASVLSNNWKWIDGTQIPDGSGYFAAYYDDDYVKSIMQQPLMEITYSQSAL